jgi:hypothetical protein
MVDEGIELSDEPAIDSISSFSPSETSSVRGFF